MKIKFYCLLGSLALIASACNNSGDDPNVVSERYIHKYGYTVAKNEWKNKNYPGQVITTYRDGATVTATYENGVLNGPYTRTYPHSQMVETHALYNQGELVKQTTYDIQGLPVGELIQLTPSRSAITLWYAVGTPMSTEEYVNEELLEGQYFTLNNEIEARVEKGQGKRVVRDSQGKLKMVELIGQGSVIKREEFYPNGIPQSVVSFVNGKIHGERRTFTENGEPLTVEEWIHGKLHGKSTYFNNGTRVFEANYVAGKKNGLETHYLDGDLVSHELYYEDDMMHGPATYYVDGNTETEYYYLGKKVSRRHYFERAQIDEMISNIPSEFRTR